MTRAAWVFVCVVSGACSPDSGASAGAGGASCGATPTACPAPPPRYAADVAPILAKSCSPCHLPGGKEQNRLLTSYGEVFPQRGAVLSQLINCKMPPSDGPAVTPEDRAKVVGWLLCGAHDD